MAILLPSERLRDFIRLFPTLLWVSLLQARQTRKNDTNRIDSSAYRVLIAAANDSFINTGNSILIKESHSQPQNTHVLDLWPRQLTYKLYEEVPSMIVAQRIISHIHASKIIDSLRGSSLNGPLHKRLLITVAKKQPIWGLFYISLAENSTTFVLSTWITILHKMRSTNRFPHDIMDAIFSTSLDISIKANKRGVQLDIASWNEFIDYVYDYSYATTLKMILESTFIVQYINPNITSAKVSTKAVATVVIDYYANSVILTQSTGPLAYTLIRNNIGILEDDALDYLLDFMTIGITTIIAYTAASAPYKDLLRILTNVKVQGVLASLSRPYFNEWFFDYLNGYTGIFNYATLDERLRAFIDAGITIKSLTAIDNLRGLIPSKRQDIFALALSNGVVDTPHNRSISQELFEEATKANNMTLAMTLIKTRLLPREVVTKFASSLSKRTKAFRDIQDLLDDKSS